MSDYKRINVGTSTYVYADTVVIDERRSQLVMLSIVGYDFALKKFAKEMDKSNNVYVEGEGYFKTNKNIFLIDKHKQSNNDFGHSFAIKKDETIDMKNDTSALISYIFYQNQEQRLNIIYDKIYNSTSVPILKEWIGYIANELVVNNMLQDVSIFCNNTERQKEFFCEYLYLNEQSLVEIISIGLKNGYISISENNTTSDLMNYGVQGLDDYLNAFGETLAEKIQQNFVPKFVPGQDKLCERLEEFDDNCYYNADIDLFDAQRSIIQANVNNFKKNNVGLVVGEMGCGMCI